MPKIKVRLSLTEIDKAVKEIQKYRQELTRKIESLVQALTDRGVEIAKLQVVQMGAIYTGELEASITGYYSPSTRVGIIKAGAWYAAYVEFGTGAVGANSPHPAPENWQYDVNNHGESGWVYFNDNDGRRHWTAGMASRPFMYNTAKQLEAECYRIAREVFAR